MDLSMMLFDVRKGTRTIDECVKQQWKLNLMFTHKNAEVENLRPENTPICKCQNVTAILSSGKNPIPVQIKAAPLLFGNTARFLKNQR